MPIRFTKQQLVIGLLIGIAVGVGWIVWVGSLTQRALMTGSVGQSASPTLVAVPSSTALPVVNKTVSSSWMSPDGQQVLFLTTTPIASDSAEYALSVSNSATQSGQVMFKKTIAATTTVSIPFNAWSPGNQYFFVQEHDASADASTTRSYVFQANGQASKNGQVAIDVNAQFNGKNPGFALGEVTGWAAPTLLIINTKTAAAQQGPSFWFDVTRNSLTRLSTKF